jgi:hypothetical protein
MSQLLSENWWGSLYNEVAGAGHWWDGVVTTDVLKEYYVEQVANAHEEGEVPETFEIVVANPADMGSKFGLSVLYLVEYGELGKVMASKDGETRVWKVNLENVMAFEWNRQYLSSTVIVDDSVLDVTAFTTLDDVENVQFWKDETGNWSHKIPKEALRDPKHFGGLEAILRTNGPITVVSYGNDSFSTALQISQNLHNYFYADSMVLQLERGHPRTESSQPRSIFANRISLSTGNMASAGLCRSDFAIQICLVDGTNHGKATISVSGPNRKAKLFPSESEEVGAIFLRPLQDRLELVIWGSNAKMLAQAARLAPTMTGIGAPDWIIINKSASWRGADGCAMGFFNAKWEISGISSFTLGSS